MKQVWILKQMLQKLMQTCTCISELKLTDTEIGKGLAEIDMIAILILRYFVNEKCSNFILR